MIFNSNQSKLTTVAKNLIKVTKEEMREIENCPDCYLNAHNKKDNWFVAACRVPHLLGKKIGGGPKILCHTSRNCKYVQNKPPILEDQELE